MKNTDNNNIIKINHQIRIFFPEENDIKKEDNIQMKVYNQRYLEYEIITAAKKTETEMIFLNFSDSYEIQTAIAIGNIKSLGTLSRVNPSNSSEMGVTPNTIF